MNISSFFPGDTDTLHTDSLSDGFGVILRVVLPSCAVKTIREKFPSENGLYTGFDPPD
jgi:hypothetical protein